MSEAIETTPAQPAAPSIQPQASSGRMLRLVLAVALLTAACSDSGGGALLDPSAVAVIQLSPTQSTIAVGSTVQLHAVPADSDGKPLADREVAWSSSNSAIASVSTTGLVTGQANGQAVITASAEGKSAQAAITVNANGTTSGQLEPVLITYMGGGGIEDVIRDVASDAMGNLYLAGGTNSSDFPTTSGAYDRSFNNPGSDVKDVFVAKVSPSGQLIWSTYLGTPNYDRAYAVEVDAQGYVYVAGRAGAGMPVTSGAAQTTFGGGDPNDHYGAQDGFLCKLTPDGRSLVFCTYFGNDDNAPIRDIALDPSGNIYVVTSAATGTFPAAWFSNAFQATRRGARDVLVAKISADGSRVMWATYVGGSDEESNTNSIRLDPSGNVLFLTSTRSADMPTPNGFDRTQNGAPDLFLGKLSPDGSQLLYGTYLGGSQPDFTETHEFEVDANGNAIVAAMTSSSDFPTTPGAFQTTFGGRGGAGTGAGSNYPGDIFIAKVSANGSQLLASTFFGGSLGEGSEGVSVDAAGNVYVAGTTFSPDFPVTQPALGPTGSADMIAAKFSPDLSTLLYSQRFGGSGYEDTRSAVLTPTGSFIIAGWSRSSDLATLSPFQSNLRGASDAAFVKLQPR